jgi:hypothetical protein
MTWLLVLAAVVVAAALFFPWASRRTAKAHARFGRKDVEGVLAQIVSPETKTSDDWDLFLAWPIDDPFLESIRQECVRIDRESRSPFDADAVAKVSALLTKIQHGT